MASQANVQSIEALDAFRASLIVFITHVTRALNEAADEVRKTRVWLQHDRRPYWEGQLRSRRKTLATLEQELLAARISSLRDSTAGQQMAVRKAKEAVHEAEAKLQRIKKRLATFDNETGEFLRQLESLRFLADHHLPKGAAFLAEASATLVSYLETRAAGDQGGHAPPASDAPADQPQQ